MYISKRVVFEIERAKKLTVNDQIDELLHLVISICQSQAPFLDVNDAKRHVYLLSEFSTFQVPEFLSPSQFVPHLSPEKDGPAPRAGRYSIHRLPWILPDWVMHYFDHDLKSMPHYALDTAVCLLDLATGVCRRYPEYWELPALVEEDRREHLYNGAFDVSFKKGFTMALDDTDGLILVGTVPEGYRMTREFSNRRTIDSGEQFVLVLNRCHLSQDREYYSSFLDIQPTPTRDFRLSEDFRLQGHAGPWDGKSDLRTLDLEQFEWVRSGIPHAWVTHEVVGGESIDVPWDLKLLPTWELPAASLSATRIDVPQQKRSSVLRRKRSSAVSLKKATHSTPASAVCANCGTPLSPAMLVWPPEKRLCRKCKRPRQTKESS